MSLIVNLTIKVIDYKGLEPKLVTLRLGDFKFIWNDIMAITTDGDGIILIFGETSVCEHSLFVTNPSSARWRLPLGKMQP